MLPPLLSLSLLFYRAQDHWPRVAPPKMGWVLPHQSEVKKMLYRLVHSLILRRHSLNSNSLSDDSSLHQADTKVSAHKESASIGNVQLVWHWPTGSTWGHKSLSKDRAHGPQRSSFPILTILQLAGCVSAFPVNPQGLPFRSRFMSDFRQFGNMTPRSLLVSLIKQSSSPSCHLSTEKIYPSTSRVLSEG